MLSEHEESSGRPKKFKNSKKEARSDIVKKEKGEARSFIFEVWGGGKRACIGDEVAGVSARLMINHQSETREKEI